MFTRAQFLGHISQAEQSLPAYTYGVITVNIYSGTETWQLRIQRK